MNRKELLVLVPHSHVAERRYILDVVLGGFLGFRFEMQSHEQDTVILTNPGSPGSISLPDTLFAAQDKDWMRPQSLPAEPLRLVEHASATVKVPVIYGDPGSAPAVHVDADITRISIDIFGSCFYLLSRYEEIAASANDYDKHGRFPSHASMLVRQNLLERPLVDEYVALLAYETERRWPHMAPQSTRYELCLTHDIDHLPGSHGQEWRLNVRRAAGDLLKRRDPLAMAQRLRSCLGRGGASRQNPVEWLMSQSEQLGAKSTFFFMAASKGRYDNGYDIGAPRLRPMLGNITRRGHAIGIHPSYMTSDSPGLFKIEIERLTTALANADVQTWSRRSRQHYLRWKAQTTWRHLDSAGIVMDSSVGFADAVGFRCGTSRRFSTFDWTTGRPLTLQEQPLIVMDATLSGRNYLALRWEDALQKVVDMASVCRRYKIPLTLLWHNDRIATDLERGRYRELLTALA